MSAALICCSLVEIWVQCKTQDEPEPKRSRMRKRETEKKETDVEESLIEMKNTEGERYKIPDRKTDT